MPVPSITKPKGHRPTTFEGDWKALVDAVGGVEDLAKLVGVTRNTVYRWAVLGHKVPGPSVTVLGMVAAQHRLANPAIR